MKPLLVAFASLATLSAVVAAQLTERVSIASDGTEPDDGSFRCSISADGRYVAFDSWATNLVPNDTNGWMDVFVRDRLTGTTTCVSVDAFGAPANFVSQSASISADGRYVAFSSMASNLVVGDTNDYEDVFVRDLWSGTTVRASINGVGVQGNHQSYEPSISADGSRVVFASYASNLVRMDTNMQFDVFLHDFTTHRTVRVNVGAGGIQANSQARVPVISADGSRVAFVSEATNLVVPDTNGSRDVFVRDLALGQTINASVATSGAQANQPSTFDLAMSADGRYVAFTTSSTNLVAGSTPFVLTVYVRDTLLGVTTCGSATTAGAPAGFSQRPALSADGRYLAFMSGASNLVSGDTNGFVDFFRRDLLLGTNELLSVDSTGIQGNGSSQGMLMLSADGRCAVFGSSATNLVAGDANGVDDLFVREL